jgi:hypothetical protein
VLIDDANETGEAVGGYEFGAVEDAGDSAGDSGVSVFAG